ncbi:MAG: hypothetical protein KJ626_14920 [Verrucomicrobia bacterium]|nr:hypothetical protein [Verrucomicrobiota bacterium]
MRPSVLKLTAAAVLFVVAILFAGRCSKPKLPPLNTSRHSDVGCAMAEETSRLLEGRGSVVAIVPKASFSMPLVDAQFKSFRKHLPKGITLEAVESIRLEEVGPLEGLLTPDIYLRVAGEHITADAIVSFVGLGVFSESDLARVEAEMPPLHVISVNVRVPLHLLEEGVIEAAVVPRGSMGVIGHRASVASVSESFNRLYEIISTDRL